MKDPSKFNRHRVSVIGLLQVAGDNNYLWRNAEAKRRAELHSSYLESCLTDLIFVMNDMGRPSYPGTNLSVDQPMNYRWVRLTGIVDTSLHGRWGEHRFVLIQGNIEPLPRPREKEFLTIQGWFKNETGHDVDMDITTKGRTAGVEEWFTLSPGDIAPVTLEPGSNVVIGKNKSTKMYAKRNVILPAPRRYYDFRRKFYYFRVLKDQIVPVLPNETKGWRLPMPDRDD